MRLANRLALAFIAVIALFAASTAAMLGASTEGAFRSWVLEGDRAKAGAYATILGDWRSEHPNWEGIQPWLAGLPRVMYEGLARGLYDDSRDKLVASFSFDTFGKILADRIVVADAEGRVVADTAGSLLGSLHPERHLMQGVPVMADWKRVGTVLVGSMVDSSLGDVGSRFLSAFSSALVVATLVSAGLALILGIAISRRITARLATLSGAAARVAAGDLKATVVAKGRDEIAALAVAFNRMTAELARLEDCRRRIIADSAHELRTPVTLIRGAVEAMIDGVFPSDRENLESVHEETMRLSLLIDMLSELEAIDSGELLIEAQSIDPLAIAGRAAALFAQQARDRDISVCSGGEVVPEARGDALRLGEIVHNLVSNAVKYTPRGGTVEIGVAREGSAGGFSITVEDSGPGIPEAERERIFERFYRLDRSRSRETGGRGLGLAIALEIAKAHGGDIAVGSSQLGGSAFTVRIPAAPVGSQGQKQPGA